MIIPLITVMIAVLFIAGVPLVAKYVDGDLNMPRPWRKRKQAWKRARREWIDVVRTEDPHECVKPYNVEAFNRSHGHGYRVGDVIECKTCAQRWKCTSMSHPFADPVYNWARVSENEDVFR